MTLRHGSATDLFASDGASLSARASSLRRRDQHRRPERVADILLRHVANLLQRDCIDLRRLIVGPPMTLSSEPNRAAARVTFFLQCAHCFLPCAALDCRSETDACLRA